MICKCGGKFRVKDTRDTGKVVYRKRVCPDCGKLILTEEYKSKDQLETLRLLNKEMHKAYGK